MTSFTPCAPTGARRLHYRNDSLMEAAVMDLKRRRNSFWTDDELESLRVLAGKGITANSLAVRFGRSRKAVLDKAKELHLRVRQQSRLPSKERMSWLAS